MIYYDKIKVIGSDSSGRSIAVVSLWVDTAASLPAANAYQSDGFILGMGSEGNCIDSGDKYRMDSSGAWQITQAGTGTYTKEEIDTLLAAKQNVLTFDTVPTENSQNPVTSGGVWSPLAELVDAGAKNICNMSASVFDSKTYDGVTVTRNDETITVSDTSGNVTNNFFNVYVFGTGQYNPDRTIPPGQWVAMFYGSGAGIDKLSLASNDDSIITRGRVNEPVEFTITSDSEHNLLRLYVEKNTTYDCDIKIMICSKAAWDISHRYIPYYPSMQKLYQMILELQ